MRTENAGLPKSGDLAMIHFPQWGFVMTNSQEDWAQTNSFVGRVMIQSATLVQTKEMSSLIDRAVRQFFDKIGQDKISYA